MKKTTRPAERSNPAQKPLELLQVDRAGPYEPTIGGNTSYQVIVDAATGYSHVDLAKSKSVGPQQIIDYVTQIENGRDYRVQAIRTDGAAEYNSKEYREFLRKKGIRQELSAPHQQSQNGLAERTIQTLNNMTGAMLLQSGLSTEYWGEAIMHASSVRNIIPRNQETSVTPYEQWWNAKPKISRFHPFGCEAFALIPKSIRKGKFNPKSDRCIFLGFADNYEAYRLQRISDRKIITSNEVRFNDAIFPAKETESETHITVTFPPRSVEPTSNASQNPAPSAISAAQSTIPEAFPIAENPLPSTIEDDTEWNHNDDAPSVAGENDDEAPNLEEIFEEGEKSAGKEPEISGTLRRSTRKIFPKRDNENFIYSLTDELESNPEMEPRSYRDAIHPKWNGAWEKPILLEYDALIRNKTWEEVQRSQIPPNSNINRPIWRFKAKANGVNKARLCFDGRFQTRNVDFYETYSPVAKYPSVRLAMTYILLMGGKIELGDVPNAFLNSAVDTDIYMEHPEGFKGTPGTVCKLLRGLYGLKQAAMLWHTDIDNFITESLGFSRLPDDRCIYTKKSNDSFVIIILYVDDIAIGSNSSKEIDEIFHHLHQRFLIKRIGPLKNSLYLGMLVNMTDDGRYISMSQSHIIKKLLLRFDIVSKTPTSSPYNPNVQLTAENGEPYEDLGTYRSIIGTLFWIARTTRPDIMFTVSVLSQYQAAPTMVHYGATIHLMRYLAGTIDKGIILDRKTHQNIYAWTDASHNDIQRDMYGTTGFIITIGKCPITWSSRKQTIRVLSSSAAEYVAASTTLDDALWISSWVSNMNAQIGRTVIESQPLLITDSSSCIRMVENRSIERDQSRFIDLRQLQILDRFHLGKFKIHWIRGKQNPADILTKSVPSIGQFRELRDKIVRDVSVVTGE